MPAKKSPVTRKSIVARAKVKSIQKSGSAKLRARRALPRRLLLHPLGMFGLLMVGVLLAALTYQALAADYTVNAVVAAEPLTMGAVITSPANNQTVTASPITVSGTCQNTAYVKLFRNGAFSGAALCDNGKFVITSDVFVGANDLQAQAYNITNTAGPQTPIVHVTYQPPPAAQKIKPGSSSASTTQATTSANTSAQLPLLLQGDYHFNVATTNSVFSWELSYQYATPPINTRIKWGDGTTSHTVVATNSSFKIEHTYANRGYYTIVVSGTDASQRTVVMQLAAYIKKPGDAPIKGSILPVQGVTSSNSGILGKLKWLVYVWPAYALIAVMGISFWLGERREILLLTKAPHLMGRRVRHAR